MPGGGPSKPPLCPLNPSPPFLAGGPEPMFSFLVVPEVREDSSTRDIVDEQSVFQLLLAERAVREAGIKQAGFVGQVRRNPRPSRAATPSDPAFRYEHSCNTVQDLMFGMSYTVYF
eukprot:1659208-Pyramimonas_sp.AAC.2